MKYMKELTHELEAKISSILPEKFALVFDGWSLDGSSTHYMAVFATFLVFIVLHLISSINFIYSADLPLGSNEQSQNYTSCLFSFA